MELIPNGTLYGERIKQIDLRFSRFFPLGGSRRVQANLDFYNLLNENTVLNEQTRYNTVGNQWRNAIQIMGGRMIKIGAQLSFNLVRPRLEVLYNTRDAPLAELETPPLGLIVSLGVDWIAL